MKGMQPKGHYYAGLWMIRKDDFERDTASNILSYRLLTAWKEQTITAKALSKVFNVYSALIIIT